MPPRPRRRISRVILGVLAAALALGAVSEQIARRRAARDFPPPGRMVDVGGRRLHLDCRGSGSPVVIFESGLGFSGSLAWSKVHDAVAATTRACAYDRAGLLWSDPAPGPRRGDAIAEDLHALLAKAGEKPPFVLVAHSIGGPYAMSFTRRFGADVAGLVFVDATHPDQPARLAAVGGGRGDPVTFFTIAAALSWTGLVRAAFPAGRIPDNAPPAAARAMLAWAPVSIHAAVDETKRYGESLADAGALRSLGDRPVVALTAVPDVTDEELAAMKKTRAEMEKILDVRKALHAEEAAWSARGRHELVAGSDHFIQLDKPEAVIAAVRSVVEAARVTR
jgi:pimeloyl-ACP methyl ester carboxylesterase